MGTSVKENAPNVSSFAADVARVCHPSIPMRFHASLALGDTCEWSRAPSRSVLPKCRIARHAAFATGDNDCAGGVQRRQLELKGVKGGD
jgi:hypothetical protein